MKHTNPNVRRAERGYAAVLAAAPDSSDELDTAVSDTVADILHLCDREGLDGPALLQKGANAYEGDAEDGPHLRDRD